MSAADPARFYEVDKSADPDFFLTFLKAAGASPEIQEIRRRMAIELRIAPGQRVLDVGCGSGAYTMALESLAGSAVGVDLSEVMIDAARRAAPKSLNVEFRTGNVTALDFPDASFDAACAERVLLHLEDPATALREMIRVTRPGGRIAVIDTDCESFAVNHPRRALTRTITRRLADTVRNACMGRELPSLLRRAGLHDVAWSAHCCGGPPELVSYLYRAATTAAVESGALDANDVAAWWSDLEDLQRTGDFLFIANFYLVSGTVPA